jgi:hypothetical protein
MHQAHQATITSMATAQKKELEGFEHRVQAATQKTQQLEREKDALKAGQAALRAELTSARRTIAELDVDDSCVLL